MPALQQLVYVSAAAQLLQRDSLLDILAISRRNNEQAGVTGMLLYVDGAFIQALEGPHAHVAQTMTRIERDSRHTRIIILTDEPVTERGFGDWSMALGNVPQGQEGMLGLSDFLRRSVQQPLSGTDPARRLLENFRHNHCRYLNIA